MEQVKEWAQTPSASMDRALALRKRVQRRVLARAARMVWAAQGRVSCPGGYRMALSRLGLDKDVQAAIEAQALHADVVLAEVDQDGYFLSHVGRLPGLPQVEPEAYLARTRNRIQLVVGAEGVGIRKFYGADVDAFMRELRALHALNRAGCRVPGLLGVDYRALTLTCAFIPGSVLREALACRGARLRDREVGAPSAGHAARAQAWDARVAEGRRVLAEVVDAAFIARLRADMERAHAAGVILNDIKYGNIIIEESTGTPYWIDFDRADVFRWRAQPMFRYLAARDHARFDQHFGAALDALAP